MIETPTTFVLGAGSTAEFGYPLGYGLMVHLWREVANPDGWLASLMGWAGYDEPERKLFASNLKYSRLQSVDDFLERADERQREMASSRSQQYS